MDIKDLNKSQLILLAVLLSFVTSIATGITTVTLMQQAPVSFTSPINRVVRQTVEKIQQVEGKTTVQTVVVKEEDLVVDAIAKNKSSVFALSKYGYDLDGNMVETSAGRAFSVSMDGVIVADAKFAPEKLVYFVKNDSGKFKAELISTDNKNGIAFLKIGDPVDPKDTLSYTVPALGDLSKMKIGQKIIVLGGTLSSSIYEGNNDINISVTKINAGGLVLNLDGEALGIVLSNEVTPFVSINTINDSLKLIQAPKI